MTKIYLRKKHKFFILKQFQNAFQKENWTIDDRHIVASATPCASTLPAISFAFQFGCDHIVNHECRYIATINAPASHSNHAKSEVGQLNFFTPNSILFSLFYFSFTLVASSCFSLNVFWTTTYTHKNTYLHTNTPKWRTVIVSFTHTHTQTKSNKFKLCTECLSSKNQLFECLKQPTFFIYSIWSGCNPILIRASNNFEFNFCFSLKIQLEFIAKICGMESVVCTLLNRKFAVKTFFFIAVNMMIHHSCLLLNNMEF